MVARFVMKSNKKRILLVLAILTMAILLSCAFVACTKAETQDAQKKEITIFFDTQGGSEISPITIRSGESLTLPKTPTKEGYVFDGWYLDSNCIEEYEDSYVVSKNITLYAKWRELVAGEEFNVIFNLNYGTDNIVEKTTENRLITYIPVRQGYRFNGWYYSDGYVEGIGYILTEKYDTTIPVTQNGLVLYAEWVDSSTDSRQLASPTISVNGTVLSWDAVKNAEKYELKFYLGKNLVKTYSTTQSSVNIDSIGIDSGTYTLKARSIGDGVSHINSAETIKHISYKVLLPVSNAKIDVESSVLTWNEANNAETYTVYIDGARFGRTYLNSLDLSKLNAGQYVIKIVAERAGYTSSNATFTLVKSRLLTPTIKIERQPNDNYSSKISWSAIYNANQYVVVVDKKEVATTSNNYYVLNDSDWGSNKKVSVSVYAKDSSADYLVSIPSEISTVTRTAKIAISHNIRNVSLVKVIGKSYSSTDNLIEDYSSADNFYVGVDFGEPKKVVAIPQNGYTWLGWYDKSGNLISTKTEYIFNAGTSSSEIVAHWASYSVALNKNDNNAGKIGFSVDDMSTQNTVSQRIVYGKEVTICASTNNGYTWLGWYKGEEKVSDEQTYTFTMSDSDLAYTAKWSKTTISVSSLSAGSVSGLSSTYKVGDKVTVTAVTNTGYTWDGWYLNGEKVSSDLKYEIQITEESLQYVATWKYYTLTTSRNISAAGTENSYWNQKVTVGDSVELVANTNKGYTWLGWYDGETLISSETTFTYEMPAESKTLIAKWTYYTLSTQTNNSEAGTYTALSDKKVTVGDSIELIASTNDGYTWLGWYDGETLISMETTYTYVMTAESKTLAAKWTYYTLSTQANDSEAGTYTVLSDKKVTVGDSIELVVSTNKGYTWLGWYDGETMISSETTYTYVMPAENKTIIAKWTYYTLSTTNGNVDAGDITLLSYKKVAVGRSIDLIAVAKPGYSFVGWYDGEKMLSGDATYSYVMTSESKIITAKWNLITYRIVYSFSKDNVEFESDLPTSYTIGEESIILQELNNGNYYVDYWYYEGNEGKRIKIIDVEQKRDLSIVGHVASCGLALSGTSVQGIGSCTQRDILLPRYNGETEIVTIADNAFKNNTTINHVSIPYSVTSIGGSAFYGCTGLMSVILGNSVTSIGSSAFYNCSRLVEIYNKSTLEIKKGTSGNGYIAYYAKNVYTEDGGNKLSTDNAGYVTYLDGEERILVAYNGTNTDLTIPNGITVIDEKVFKNRYDLTSITIPDSVTSIGYQAFDGCDNLQDIYITDIAAWFNISGLDNLMNYGSNNKSLYLNNELITSVTIPDGVTVIPSYGFYNCTGLTSVTIPDSVTSIGERAFRGCTGLTSITIPDSVTSIGAWAFWRCSGLTSITISDSVTSIGDGAFYGCSGLTSITIPDNVTSIGDQAFYNCTGLTSITIPDRVTSIGNYAFYGCTGLTSITIPDSVTSIGNYAFNNTAWYNNQPDGLVYAGKVAYKYKGTMPSNTSIVIKDGTLAIASYAFYNCSGLTSITIPDSVTSIGKNAFSSCTGLTGVTIPDSVTSIGEWAFYGCSSLESITMPFVGTSKTASNGYDQVFGYIFGYTTTSSSSSSVSGATYQYNGNFTYYHYYIPSSIKSVTITRGSIPSCAFYNCTGLTSITIPDSVTSIGNYAFYGCTGLTSITIPDSVTSIGRFAFNNTAWYNNQPDGLVYAGKVAYKYKGTMPNNASIVIKNGTLGIAGYAFSGCSSLTSITIPDSVTSIGDSAFSGCNNLQNIYITDIAVWFNISGLSNLMKYGASNKKLYINNELATSITIPNGVTAIPSNAFSGCTGLTSITIPDSVTSIGISAFDGCTGLTSVAIGNGVTSISGYAFSGCSKLQNIYITDIAAWFNISGLDNLMLYGSNSKSIYLNNELITSVTIPEGMTTIPSYAFYNCSSLTSITIPDSVTNIGENALYNCNGLTRIDVSTNNTVYASVDGILYNKAKTEFIIIPKAIQGVVTIPSGVTNIGNWAFFNCNGLTSIFIPSGVNEIGEYAFYLCRNLVDVFIPNSVACIGQYAFYNCSKLERISFDGTTSQWENITKGGFWRYNTPSDCQIICDDPELEPMTEVKLEMPSNGYNIGWHWYQLPYVDNAFAYKFTFGNGDDDGIILNRSTLTFYDIPIDAKYIEYKALGGVLNGVRYLDSDSRRVDLAFWHYPVKYQSETYSVRKLLKKELKLSEITSIKFGKLEEEHGESAIEGTSFWRGRGGYLLIEGSDSNGVPKKLCYLMPGKYMSLGEMFDRIPELVYYDELSVEAVNDTNRFELEDFKYYMQNEIIPHMQENYPKYAAFFNTCDMADYEITNYVGFGVYYDRYDHEAQIVSVDLKNAQGRTLHLELAMDMQYGSVENWKYVREHNMLFSQVKTVDPYMTEKLHSYWIYPTTYFDNDGDKAIKPNEEFNQKIIDTESNGIAYIYPSINYYLNGEEKDTLWDEHLSYLSIYPMPFLSKIKNKTYAFVTNCEQTIEPITGERYTVSLPKLTREGYVFCGWYDNEAFEGRAYFDTYGSSDKSTLYAKWLPKEEPPMPDGTSFEMAFIAQSGKTYDASITTSGQIVYFAFTPTADGTFTIQSIGSCDTYGNLYSSTKSLLATNDDGGTGNNFKLTYNMKAGTTYYVAIRLLYTPATGTFKVSFS